jgi:uncharacterized protein YlxW (UPF0749 family)
MYEQTVEVLSRRAAASMSRRGSLLSLGGALAAAVAAPSLAQAKKNTKKSKKAKKRKAQQRAAEQAENQANQVCQSQVEGCRTLVVDLCEGQGNECLAAANCCSSLGACDVTGFFACVDALPGAGE